MIANEGLLYFVYISRGWIKLIVCLFIFPFPFLHLFKIQLDLGERCKLPSGVWGGAPAEIEFGAISIKICNLVVTILVIFHWGNFSKVVCFSHMRIFSQFKGGHGPSGPMVNTPMLA